MTKYNILAVIPARGGSKRIKNKNLKILHNKPLIYWSINAAIRSKYINEICVTSDSEKILKYSEKLRVKTIRRPARLSTDKIHADKALIHVCKKFKNKYDYVVMLQPTSPLRTARDIDQAIKKIILSKSDSLLSACKESFFIWKKKLNKFTAINYNYRKRPRHQDVEFYRENGAIYITKLESLLKNKNRLAGKVQIYCMTVENSIDIDTLNDFKIANSLMMKKFS